MRQWAVAREMRERIRDAFNRGELSESAATAAIAVAGEGAGAGSDHIPAGPPSSVDTSSAGGRPTGPTGTAPSG
jgi:hypothetical protein